MPDEATNEPYIIPVDVSGANIAQAIKLEDIYSRLTKYPAKRVTVFLDACFSGGARNHSLGDIQYKTLADYLKTNVAKQTGLISIPQTPQLQYSNQVQENWETWKIK